MLHASELRPDDIVLYTAATWWRVLSATPAGKSVDIVYVVEQDLSDAGTSGTNGEHRFRQSTQLLVTRTGQGFAEPPMTVTAGELAHGHVVHVNAKQTWLVEASEQNGKSVDVAFTVVRDDDPLLLQTDGTHRFRQSTFLLIGPPDRASGRRRTARHRSTDTASDTVESVAAFL
ncbi:hypothetical protein ASF30_09110 [Leifsonia sp. Leaf264]|nr:hypothetical protein ASF30_09110 [Leifsonia sp. Leaf264]